MLGEKIMGFTPRHKPNEIQGVLCLGVKPMILSPNISKKKLNQKKNFKNFLSPGFKAFQKNGFFFP